MNTRKIGFCGGAMTLRGVHIALFDYALHNQIILGNQSIVFYEESGENDPSVISKFQEYFELIPYQNFKDLNKVAEKSIVEAMYIIKSGEIDSQIIESVPNLIHAVFPQKISDKHGEVYAFVSEWLSKECSNYKIPFVPHMISLSKINDNLRMQLNIPQHAVVFGSYGGKESFNLEFVLQSIRKIIYKRLDAYFIFMNISPFIQHDRIFFIPGNPALDYKVKFINTCDAMIHARGIGESFGLACGEFSIRNKPIITYALSPQRSHLEILGHKAIKYKCTKEIDRIFMDFDKAWFASQDWDCYSEKYSPVPVMEQFDQIFLKNHFSQTPGMTIIDQCAIQYFRAKKKIRSLSRKFYQ